MSREPVRDPEREVDAQRYRWAAFVSYRHTPAARAIATSLEGALRTYGLSRLSRPRRIFRDEQSLRPGDPIGPAIREALRASRFLIYLAEREAAESRWVNDELDFWCRELRRSDRLVVVHVGDRLSFSAATKQIDWDGTDALPASLREHLEPMPLISNLAWVTNETDRSLQHPRFLAVVIALAARLEDVTPEEMSGKEIAAHRKNRVLLIGALALIAAASVIAVVFGLVSRAQREEALQVARAAQLEARALEMEPVDTTKAFRIAQKAYELKPTTTNRRLLNKWYVGGSFYARQIDHHGGGVNDMMWTAAGLFVGNGPAATLLGPDESTLELRPKAAATLTVGILAHGTQLGTLGAGDEMRGTATLVRWDPATGRELARFDLGDQVSSAAFSDAPPVLVAATLNHGVVLHDLAGARPPRRLLDGHATAVAITRSGSKIAVATGDGIQILGGPALSVQKTLSGDDIKLVRFGPDEDTLVTAAGSFASVQHIGSGDVTAFGTRAHESPVSAVAVRNDGSRIAIGHEDGSIVLWDRRGNRLHTIAAHRDAVRGLAFSPDGQWLASSGGSATRIWAATHLDEPTWIRPVGIGPVCAFAEDGGALLVEDREGHLAVWTLDGTPTGRGMDVQSLAKAALHADGTIVAADNQHLVSSNGAAPVLLELGVSALATLPRPGARSGTVLITWDQLQVRDDKLALLASTKVPSGTGVIAVSPRGDRIAVGQDNGHITIWTPDLKPVAELPAHALAIESLAFSRSGRYLVAGSYDKTATIHDPSGATLATLIGARDSIALVGFTPDEQYVVTFDRDLGAGTGLLWDWRAGIPVQRLQGSAERIESGAVSPIAPLALACAGDARVWDLRSSLDEFLHSDRIHRFTEAELTEAVSPE